MKMTVYLAGPVMACTWGEANDWRIEFAKQLAFNDIRGVSPLRCEPLIGARYSMNHPDPKFGTARVIGAKNMFDVRQCDMTLAYIPKPEPGRVHSLGTVTELAWAKMKEKPTILVSDDPFILEHPVLSACSGWVLTNLDDALEVIIGVLGGYTIGGKNV